MRIVLLGPPGAGKGTLAALIKEKHGIVHISTGDILREEMKSGSDLGREVQQYVDSGELVPDEVIIRIIESKLANDSQAQKGFILDGFPRTVNQAEALDSLLKKLDLPIDYVLYMDTQVDLIIRRLTGRRICRQCGAVYHVVNRPPSEEGVCDVCGGKDLYQRADDNEDTIRNRMDVYLSSTMPIVEYYGKQGKLEKVDGGKEAELLLDELPQP